MPPLKSIAAICLYVALVSSATASEYCTKEQYQHDHELIESATKSGMLVEGPKGLRDSILVQEGMWFGMNYPRQIAFMQSFECSIAGLSGKHLLVMDVRSLATGNLLATWFAGTLKPAEGPHDLTNRPVQEPPDVTNPGTSEVTEDENRIGLTGEARAAFIKFATDACNKRGESINCYCYANAMADIASIKELKEASAPGTQEAATITLRPKMDAAAKRCLTN